MYKDWILKINNDLSIEINNYQKKWIKKFFKMYQNSQDLKEIRIRYARLDCLISIKNTDKIEIFKQKPKKLGW